MNVQIEIIVQFNDEKFKGKLIKDYKEFLNKCCKEFNLSNEEIKTFKLFVLDYGDEISIENESDFKENLEPDDNNQIKYILKGNRIEKKPEIKEEHLLEEINKILNENYEKNQKDLKEYIKNTFINFNNSKEKYYECFFSDGNYTLNSYYNDLIKEKNFNFNISILNKGNLNWPKNSFIIGNSENNILSFKKVINPENEILPEQKIEINISINLEKIKNENIKIILPLKFSFQNELIQIKQNTFKFILIIKKSIEEEINKLKDINQKNPKILSNQVPEELIQAFGNNIETFIEKFPENLNLSLTNYQFKKNNEKI
jgi:hypothetical protein